MSGNTGPSRACDTLLESIETLVEVCVRIGHVDRRKFEMAKSVRPDPAAMASAIIQVRRDLESRAELKNMIDALFQQLVEHTHD